MIKKILSFFYCIEWVLRRKLVRDSNPIFIVGMGHSGTSILHRLLGYHPGIFFIAEETAWFCNKLSCSNKGSVLALIKTLSFFHSKYFLEKTPNHLYSYNEIVDIFPNAKFILITRDPRDIYASYIARDPSKEIDYPSIIKNGYMEMINIRQKSNVYSIKLEELVINPTKNINNIFGWLNLDYIDVMKIHGKIPEYVYSKDLMKQTNELGGEAHVKHRNWQINQPIFSSTKRWESSLNHNQLKALKETVSKYASDFGYNM